MNHYDPDTGIKIEPIEISKDLLSLFNRILDQNEMILRSNEKMLELLGTPRFLYHNKFDSSVAEKLREQFR